MTKVAAIEAGPQNVRVNVICPGFILSEMGVESLGTYGDEMLRKATLGRGGRPTRLLQWRHFSPRMGRPSSTVQWFQSTAGGAPDWHEVRRKGRARKDYKMFSVPDLAFLPLPALTMRAP